MCFKEEKFTIKEYLQKKLQGYAHCALFDLNPYAKYWVTRSPYKSYEYAYYKNNSVTCTKGMLKIDFTRNEYFKETSIVTVDIDLTKFKSAEKFIQELIIKPTVVYMSYNDNKMKNGIVSRRFHLDYIFEHPLNEQEFNYVAPLITRMVEYSTNEKLEDTCGERMSQFFCGVYGNKEHYITNNIYSIDDFEKFNVFTMNIISDQQVANDKGYIVASLNINYNMLRDMDEDKVDYDTFMKYNRHKYQYIYRVERESWVNNRYQIVEPDYFALFWNVNRLKDGQDRRKKVFERMCLRRVMKPDIDANTLIFCAYEDVHRFFDNSDRVFTPSYYEKNCISAFNMSIEEIEEKYSSDLERLREKRPKRGIIYKSRKRGESHSSQHSKEDTFTILDNYYQTSWNVKANLEHINDTCGFPVCLSTLYEYCKSRGIMNGRVTDDELLTLVDKNLSINENITRIKSLHSDIKVGKDRIRKALNTLKSQSAIDDDRSKFIDVSYILDA